MRPKSSTLFHFTKNIDYLQGILQNGFKPRFCLEDTRWLGIDSIDFLAYPMTCFCDIPLSRIAEHTGFYGSYGLGMTRDWGLRNELAPIIYAPTGSAATKVVDYLISIKAPGTTKAKETERARRDGAFGAMMSFIKPLVGNMLIGDKPIEKEFYQESEWRYVPRITGWDLIKLQKQYEDSKEELQKKMDSHALSFTAQDIKYIFVAHEHEIPKLFDFITNQLDHFPHKDVKLLTTRIVSLESLAGDV